MPRVYPARTVLAQRIRERRLTFEEFSERLEIFARENNEVGTVSVRHMQRLAAGQCTSDQLRPATARLLERYFESPIDELLVSPETKSASPLTPPPDSDSAEFLLTNKTTGAVIDLFDGAPVGADYVESLHRTIKHLVSLDGVHGGADIAPLALRSFHRAQFILREGRYESALERDLEAVTAEMGELSGWLLFDAERHQESRRVNAEALTLARIAGDVSMEWFVLSNQALASVHTGRNREALRIARRMTCGQDLPGRVQALFDVRAARALAALGDSNSALRAFDRARSAFADGTTRRDPAWSWWFDKRELAGHEGMIYAALGDHNRALPQLATAVERSQGREHFRWALYIHRANLLRALLRAGSWAEAERVAIDIVPMVGIIASARTEGLLRRTVAHPEARPQMPSTLSDILDYIGNRLAES